MIKNDKWIVNQCKENNIIDPFVESLVSVSDKGEKVISYGVSSYGYDLRCGNRFEIFHAHPHTYSVDPKNEDSLRSCIHIGDHCVIPANCSILTHTLEKVTMPDNCLGWCIGKSTYARCGIIANFTPIEPGFEGYITIELCNCSHRPVKVYAGEGIVQLVFHEGEKCLTTYRDRNGKYQYQKETVTHAKV